MDAVEHADAVEGCRHGGSDACACACACADTDSDADADADANANADTYAYADTDSDADTDTYAYAYAIVMFSGLGGSDGVLERGNPRDVQRPQLSEQVVDEGR